MWTREDYWHYLLLVRVADAKRATYIPEERLEISDLSSEQVIPLQRNSPYPGEGRPFRVITGLLNYELLAIRSRAQALVDIHLGTSPTLTLGTTWKWLFSDTARAEFGTEVDPALFGSDTTVAIRGPSALMRLDVTPDGEVTKKYAWTWAERVSNGRIEQWRRAKMGGGAGHPILLDASGDSVTLFRDAYRHLQPATSKMEEFEGPSACKGLVGSIVRSGLEPVAWVNQWVGNAGISATSGTAIDRMCHVMCLHYFYTLDGVYIRRSRAAEHTSRRILQWQRAVARNARSPNFDDSGTYLRHLAYGSGTAHTPDFDRHVADIQKAEAQIFKSERHSLEERLAQDSGSAASSSHATVANTQKDVNAKSKAKPKKK